MLFARYFTKKLQDNSLLITDFVSKISSKYRLENLDSNLHAMMLQLWPTLVKSSGLLLNLSFFLITIAYKCTNFATVKIVVYCIVLCIGLCVSIKNVFSHKKKMFIGFNSCKERFDRIQFVQVTIAIVINSLKCSTVVLV